MSDLKLYATIELESPYKMIDGKERYSKLLKIESNTYKWLSLVRNEMAEKYGNDIDFRPLHIDLYKLSPCSSMLEKSLVIHNSKYEVSEPHIEFLGRGRALTWMLPQKEHYCYLHITIGFWKGENFERFYNDKKFWINRIIELYNVIHVL